MDKEKSLMSVGQFAEVLNVEEKGSDVNIATYMLVDAFRRDCDQLVVSRTIPIWWNLYASSTKNF